MLNKLFWLIIMLVFSFSTNIFAGIVVLKSGLKLEGKIVEQTDKYIKIDPGVGMVMTYYSDEIDTIDGQKLQNIVSSGPSIHDRSQPQKGIINAIEVDKAVNSENDVIPSNCENALPLLKNMIAQDPSNESALLHRATCYWSINRPDLALNDYLKIRSLDSKDVDVFKNIGLLYLRLNNLMQAENYLGMYLQVHPDDAEAQAKYALANHSIDDLNKAESMGWVDTENIRGQIMNFIDTMPRSEMRCRPQTGMYHLAGYCSEQYLYTTDNRTEQMKRTVGISGVLVIILIFFIGLKFFPNLMSFKFNNDFAVVFIICLFFVIFIAFLFKDLIFN